MRRALPFFALLLCLFLLGTGCERKEHTEEGPREEGEVAPTAYHLSAELLPAENLLHVVTEIDWSCPADDLAAVKLNLFANLYREGTEVVTSDKLSATYAGGVPSYGGAKILGVTCDGASVSYDLGREDRLMTVRLSEKKKRGDRVRLEIDEEITLARSKHRLGVYDGYYSLAHFYPEVCPFEEGKFVVADYSPYGDPFRFECADFTVDLTVPIGCECAASSHETLREIQGTTTHFSYVLEGARDFAVVCSKKLRYAEKRAGDLPIRYYYASDPKCAETLSHVEKAVETFQEMFGAFPYPTYSVVLAPFFEAGAEHSGLSVVSNALSSADRKQTIVHETAHEWWFGQVGNDEALHPWMDEGLAEYAVAAYYKNVGAETSSRMMIRTAEDAFAIRLAIKGQDGARFDLPLSELADGYYDRVYCGGLMLFAAISERYGEESFHAALRSYARDYARRTATPADLISSLSSSLGEDLSPLFTAYLTATAPIQ